MTSNSPRTGSEPARMLDRPGPVNSSAMEGVRLDRVLWGRINNPHHYAGSLGAADGSIRLEGEDTTTGIRVSLAIPFAEVERIRLSRTPAEQVAGEPCVVIEFAEAEAICLMQADAGPARSRSVAGHLARLVGVATASTGEGVVERRGSR